MGGTGFHEDVESILVAPGCVLFGYDENDQNERGTGISVSAVGKRDWIYRELSSHRFTWKTTLKQLNVFVGQKLGKQQKSNLLSLETFWMKLLVGLALGLLQNIVTCGFTLSTEYQPASVHVRFSLSQKIAKRVMVYF